MSRPHETKTTNQQAMTRQAVQVATLLSPTTRLVCADGEHLTPAGKALLAEVERELTIGMVTDGATLRHEGDSENEQRDARWEALLRDVLGIGANATTAATTTPDECECA